MSELCGLCGEPMSEGEQMFKFHGYSGPCPKEPLASREGSFNWGNFGKLAYEKYLDSMKQNKYGLTRFKAWDDLHAAERLAWIESAKEVCAVFGAAVTA